VPSHEEKAFPVPEGALPRENPGGAPPVGAQHMLYLFWWFPETQGFPRLNPCACVSLTGSKVTKDLAIWDPGSPEKRAQPFLTPKFLLFRKIPGNLALPPVQVRE